MRKRAASESSSRKSTNGTRAIVDDYVEGVLGGSIVACQQVKQCVRRYLDDLEQGASRGLSFDIEAAERAIDFFSYLKHSKGEWAGKPFRLAPWQTFVTWNLFGWKRENGFRRFRKCYVEVARKNGKSTWSAGIGNYLAFADNENGAEVYSCATKKDQAKIVHEEAVRMIRASPELLSYVDIFKDSLTRPLRNQKFLPLGADEDTMDGLNIHGAIIDEVHAHKNYGVYDRIETATGARNQPLIFLITTAGVDRTSLCWDLHTYSEGLLSRSIEDDSFFSFVATLDEGDSWKNPEVWLKSNPNLGISKKLDQMIELAEKAKRIPAALNSFLRFHLNVWTKQVKRWLDMDLWAENSGTLMPDDALRGRLCYGGLDLSSVSDISAFVLAFPQPSDPEALSLRCRFWCPEEKLTDPHNRYGPQYQAWHRAGFLDVTPGNAIDYQFIRAEILNAASQFELKELAVDRLFQGYQLSMELADDGLTVVGMGMGFLSMAGPTRELERRLLVKKIHHGGHPVLRWMAENCAVKDDPAGNIKPDKANSQGKIDGIIALLLALDRHMRHQDTTSIYEKRGLTSVGAKEDEEP